MQYSKIRHIERSSYPNPSYKGSYSHIFNIEKAKTQMDGIIIKLNEIRLTVSLYIESKERNPKSML